MRTFIAYAILLLVYSSGKGQDIIRDITFNNDRNTANAVVRCIAVQADQKVVFFGNFSFYNGVWKPYGTRVLKNGEIDPDFQVLNMDGRADVVVVQPWDQKILIGGGFTTINGVSRRGVARLHTDGSLDLSFNPGTGIDGSYGGDMRVWDLVVKDAPVPADRRIIIGGQFETYNGVHIGTKGGVVQLFENGTRDASYNPLVEDGAVYALCLDSSNKLLVGGEFWKVGGSFKLRIARLNENGTLDNTFSSGTGFAGPFASVTSIGLMPDNRIVIGGYFQQFNSITRRGLARLNADGSLDPTFNTGDGFQNGTSVHDFATEVRTVLPMADGSVIVGGNFTTFNGIPCGNIIRLKPDGTLDTGPAFGTGFNEWVMDLKLQAYLPGEARILAGGFFNTYRSTAQGSLMRMWTPISLAVGPPKTPVTRPGAKNEHISFAVFPNPYKEKITIRSLKSKAMSCTVQLFNAEGKLLLTRPMVAGTGNDVQIDIPVSARKNTVLRIVDAEGKTQYSTYLISLQ
ncbi:MAG: hypothetical protein ACTHMC_24035 [Pseudobacter sp.]|uniref:hypothetical protein n=1 Tax=Pseudobacter sp. TaxID=2045420 RepID=UPI003F7E24E3